MTDVRSNQTMRFLVEPSYHHVGKIRVGQYVKVDYSDAAEQLRAANIGLLAQPHQPMRPLHTKALAFMSITSPKRPEPSHSNMSRA